MERGMLFGRCGVRGVVNRIPDESNDEARDKDLQSAFHEVDAHGDHEWNRDKELHGDDDGDMLDPLERK